MAHLPAYDYEGWGTWAGKIAHFTQAIRIGDHIVISGQGGWDARAKEYDLDNLITKDIAGEIAQAFDNVEVALKEAGGAGWSQVYKMTTYSTDIPSQHEHINANAARCMPKHKPVWTEVGVKQLGVESMHFEIEVEAHIG